MLITVTQLINLTCFRFYNSLPPITKAYGTICVAATAALHLGLYSPLSIALFYEPVFSQFQVKYTPIIQFQ